jgi:transcriptional regulator with XRE-family HTH domain
MDATRLGLGIRALRRRRGWTQTELGRRSGTSQSAVSRAERHPMSLTLVTLRGIGEALGARFSLRLYWQGEDLDRLLDAAHAGLVDEVVRLLTASGWEVIPEATFNYYGERGSIDVLAFHAASGTLLVIEVESVVPDMQAMLSGIDRKARVATSIARRRGWNARVVARLLVLPDDRTSRRRVERHGATLGAALPARTREVRRGVHSPAAPLAGILFLSDAAVSSARHRVAAPRRGARA